MEKDVWIKSSFSSAEGNCVEVMLVDDTEQEETED